jgi:DNA-binding XRE family transcriptional regulator
MIEKFMTEPHLRLKIMRELFELNRFCFATLLGVKYRTYNTWEKQNIRPNTTAEIKMIKLGLNPNYLRGANNMFLHGYSYDKVKNKIDKLIKKDI